MLRTISDAGLCCGSLRKREEEEGYSNVTVPNPGQRVSLPAKRRQGKFPPGNGKTRVSPRPQSGRSFDGAWEGRGRKHGTPRHYETRRGEKEKEIWFLQMLLLTFGAARGRTSETVLNVSLVCSGQGLEKLEQGGCWGGRGRREAPRLLCKASAQIAGRGVGCSCVDGLGSSPSIVRET